MKGKLQWKNVKHCLYDKKFIFSPNILSYFCWDENHLHSLGWLWNYGQLSLRVTWAYGKHNLLGEVFQRDSGLYLWEFQRKPQKLQMARLTSMTKNWIRHFPYANFKSRKFQLIDEALYSVGRNNLEISCLPMFANKWEFMSRIYDSKLNRVQICQFVLLLLCMSTCFIITTVWN